MMKYRHADAINYKISHFLIFVVQHILKQFQEFRFWVLRPGFGGSG
jgi:hypothetical protein